MSKNTSTNNCVSYGALKGATSGALIGARFCGPHGIVIGAAIGGVVGYIFDD